MEDGWGKQLKMCNMEIEASLRNRQTRGGWLMGEDQGTLKTSMRGRL
jgi:hypothetical protein